MAPPRGISVWTVTRTFSIPRRPRRPATISSRKARRRVSSRSWKRSYSPWSASIPRRRASDAAFEARLRGMLADQGEYDRFHDRLETRLRAFLEEIVAGLRGRLGIENVRVTVQTEIPRGGAIPDSYTAFGGPFYG